MPQKGEKRNGKVWDGKRWVYQTSISPTVIPRLSEKEKDWTDLQRLNATVDRQRARITALGGEVPAKGHEKNPSILHRVFDVISRPSYASAGFFSHLVDEKGHGSKDDKTNIIAGLKGAWRGLQGKEKKSFSDVLKEADPRFKGPGYSALGLGLDVALDPTSYTGVGIVNKGEEAAKLSAKAAQLGADAVKTEHALAKAGKSKVVIDAVDEALKAARASGSSVSVREVARDAIAKRAFDIAKTEETALLAANKPQFGIKALGREMRLPVVSEPIGEAVTAAGERFRNLPGIRQVSTRAQFPGGVNTYRLQHVGVSALETKRQIEEWIPKLSGMDKTTRETVVDYLKKGIPHSDPEVQQFMKDFRDLMDQQAMDEIQFLGNSKLADVNPLTGKLDISKGTYDPNYVPDVWHKGSYMRTFKDAAEAEKEGYKKVTDIADILAYKIDKHNREMGKWSLAQHLADQFGVKSVGGQVGKTQKALFESGALTNKVSLPYMPKSVYFDHEIADGMNRLAHFFTNDESLKNFFRQYDKMQAKWKFLTTVPNPGFHARNLLSDMWTNTMDGLIPNMASTPYKAAWQEMVAPALKDVQVGRRVEHITADTSRHVNDFVQAYDGLGLRSGYYRAEVGKTAPAMLHQRIPGAVGQKMRDLSEVREDFTRFAHFVDATVKETRAGKSWQKATEAAAERVRKFNFDYNDFTPFEAKVMKRAIPFYSWMRKNIPLQLTLLATQPGKLAIAPKGIRALQEIMGTKGQEPLPGLPNLVPLWAEEAGAFLVGSGRMGESGPKVAIPSFLPMADAAQYFEGIDQLGELGAPALQGPAANLISGVSPFARVPIEMAAGKEFFSGRDIQPNAKSWNDYLFRQFVPPKRYTSDIINSGDQSIAQKALSSLSPVSVRTIQPRQMTSELRRQQDRYDSTIGKVKQRAWEEWLKRNGLAP